MDIGKILGLITGAFDKVVTTVNTAQPGVHNLADSVLPVVSQGKDLVDVAKSLFEGTPPDRTKLEAAEKLLKDTEGSIASS